MPDILVQALDTVLDRTIVGGYSRIGFAVRRQTWPDGGELPRLDGHTIAVTGATSGIGRAAAEQLARLGAVVLLLVRDPTRGERTRSEIAAATGNDSVSTVSCDLASLASVRSAAATIRREHPTLDGLVNNAGVMPPERTLTRDGLELTLQTNVLAPFLLTNLLAPALAEAAPSRVVVVSSGGMYGQRLDLDNLQAEKPQYKPAVVYARSKRAEVVLAEVFAERLARRGVAVHAMHPGWVDTPGVQSSLPRFRRITGPILRTPDEGADTIAWLLTAPESTVGTSGFWHDRRRRPLHLLPRTRETAAERQVLWDRCIRLSGYHEEEDAAPAGAAKA